MVVLQIFLQPAVSVVNASVQHQFAEALLQGVQRDLAQQRDGIVIQRAPARRIDIAE